MKAMILAAGLGTRLLPYTLKRPKPLFPVLNIPLLHLTINRLKMAGASDIVLNAHHLRQKIKKALPDIADIILQEEEEILGTGGGLRRALHHFGSGPVLVVNGDIYHSIDYRDVYCFHCKGKADVTLVLHEYPRFSSVAVDNMLHITDFNRSTGRLDKLETILAFTGIHVINPDILQAIPLHTPCSIIDVYKDFLRQGGTIRAYRATRHFWTDMGTPGDYLKLHADLLEGKVPIYDELIPAAADAPFVGLNRAAIGKNVKLLDWTCIGGNATIGADSILQRVVIWDGAVVPAGSTIQDAIITT